MSGSAQARLNGLGFKYTQILSCLLLSGGILAGPFEAPCHATGYTLSVTTTGGGTGTVASGNGKLNCGATCSVTFGSGVAVGLSATAAAGSYFSGWSGAGCSGTRGCTVVMNGNQSLTATFLPEPQLTVTLGGAGTGTVVSGNGTINCGSTCSATYGTGVAVGLSATAASGSFFSGWSGAGCSGKGGCSVVMNGAQSVTATFLPVPVLTVTLAGAGSGTVVSGNGTINCGSTCSATYGTDVAVGLSATAASGSFFSGWSGAGCSGTGGCSVVMNGAQSVTATFLPQALLTVTLAGAGTGTVASANGSINCGATCSAEFDSGVTADLAATGTAGSSFVGWSGAGCSGTGSCRVQMSAAESVTATFNPCANQCAVGDTCSQPSDCVSGSCVSGVCQSPQCASDSDCASGAGVCQSATCTDDKTCSYSTGPDGTGCGMGQVCSSGSCVADCFINGTLYSSGQADFSNPCQVCSPSTSTTMWSTEPNGTSCHTGGICADFSAASSRSFGPEVQACGGSSGVCSSGSCAPFPSVTSTSPQDGSTPVAGPTITVTFNQPMDPSTLSAQTVAGGCSGTVQVAHNDDSDSDCIAFRLGTPAMSQNNTVATFTADPGLLVNRAYTLTVTTAATSLAGASMQASYTMSVGFTTVSPSSPVVQNESGSALEVNYCDIHFPLSYIGIAGDSVTFDGQVFESGVTGSGMANPALSVQFGYAPSTPSGTPLFNPEYEAAWTWADASYDATCSDCGSNDQYTYTARIAVSGSYSYAFRVSLDGGDSWTVCDVGGAGSNGGVNPFDFDLLPLMQLNGGAPD